jgi:hypothetical protein
MGVHVPLVGGHRHQHHRYWQRPAGPNNPPISEFLGTDSIHEHEMTLDARPSWNREAIQCPFGGPGRTRDELDPNRAYPPTQRSPLVPSLTHREALADGAAFPVFGSSAM